MNPQSSTWVLLLFKLSYVHQQVSLSTSCHHLWLQTWKLPQSPRSCLLLKQEMWNIPASFITLGIFELFLFIHFVCLYLDGSGLLWLIATPIPAYVVWYFYHKFPFLAVLPSMYKQSRDKWEQFKHTQHYETSCCEPNLIVTGIKTVHFRAKFKLNQVLHLLHCCIWIWMRHNGTYIHFNKYNNRNSKCHNLFGNEQEWVQNGKDFLKNQHLKIVSSPEYFVGTFLI